MLLCCVSTTPPLVPPLPSMSRLGSFLSPPASCPCPCPCPLSSSPPPPESGRAPTRRPLAFLSPPSLSCGRGGWSGAVFALGSREREGKKKNSGRRFARRSLAEAAASKRDTELQLRFGAPDHFEAKGILTIT